MSKISPTVGRKLYFYPNGDTAVKQLDSQPVDATVLYVHPDSGITSDYLLNLLVVDHVGNAAFKSKVRLVQDGEDDPTVGFYARCMPYQIGQAAKQAAASESVPAAPEAAAEAPTGEAAGAGVTPETPQSSLGSLPPDTSHSAQSTPAEITKPALDFGGALAWLKQGKPVTRAGWGNAKVCVYLVKADSYPARSDAAKAIFGENALVPYGAYLAIVNQDGTVLVFNPGIDSILAEDWYAIL